MYVNFIEGVVRLYESSFPDPDTETPVETYVFRTYAVDDQIDPDHATRDIRRWLLAGRHTHFMLDERRQFADIGAEGASLTYVLDLLGSGAAGVAIHEIVQFLKNRLGGDVPPADEWRLEQFRTKRPEEHGDEALARAERLFHLSRGTLKVTDVEVGQFEVTVRAENPITTERFRIVTNADESVTIRKLPSR